MCTGFEIPALFEAFGAAEGLGAIGTAVGGAEAAGGLASLTGALGEGALGAGILGGGAEAAAALGGGSLFGAEALGSLGALGGIEGGFAGGLGDLGASLGGDALGGAAGGWGNPVDFGGPGVDMTNPAAFGTTGGDGFTGNALQSVSSGGSGFNFPDAFTAFQKYASPVSSGISGIMGLQKQAELRRLAKMAVAKSDPWGTSGGRSLADSQLQELLRNPSGVASSDPAYKLRIQGAQRANAQYGQDSGRMSVAGADASTDWYNQRLAQLGGLAGAGVNPGSGQQLALQGAESANDLLGSSLGSFGYGAATLGGGAGGLTQQQQSLLLALSRRPGG